MEPEKEAMQRILRAAREAASAGRAISRPREYRSRSRPIPIPAPRRSPRSSHHEHGGDKQNRLTVDDDIAGVTREAARAAARPADIGTLEPGKRCDLAIWDIERPAELVYRIGFNPLHARGTERPMTLTPARRDACLVAQPRRGGAAVRLDSAAVTAIEASAATVDAIVEKGAPVYGINTGFGKLASVRIAPDELGQLQRNIVLSHAAGVGEPMRSANVRLMLALKLASLARGASGVRLKTLEFMLENARPRRHPGGAETGLGRRVGRSRAARAHDRLDARIGEAVRRRAHAGRAALARAGLAPLVLGPKEGLALLNGTQFSTARRLSGCSRSSARSRPRLVTGALATDAAKGSDTPFDPRIHALRGHRGQIEVAEALRALMAAARSAPRTSPRTIGCRIPTACAASRR